MRRPARHELPLGGSSMNLGVGDGDDVNVRQVLPAAEAIGHRSDQGDCDGRDRSSGAVSAIVNQEAATRLFLYGLAGGSK